MFHSIQALVLYPENLFLVRGSACLREAEKVKQKGTRGSDTKANGSSEFV